MESAQQVLLQQLLLPAARVLPIHQLAHYQLDAYEYQQYSRQ
jgi:hypothetical protein